MVKNFSSITASSLRVLSYNCWHGLSGQGLLRFKELEPAGRRARRLKEQQSMISKLDPDVAFFQEVNPVGSEAQKWAECLGGYQFHQGDNSGGKILGRGLPSNLNTGLVIVLKPEWEAMDSWSVRLSGDDWSTINDLFSLQVRESRYALFVMARHKLWGRVLFVNVHLHHGLAETEEFVGQVKNLETHGIISRHQSWKLRERVSQGEGRREAEALRLMRAIRQVDCGQVVLGGDFNGSPWANWMELVRRGGFIDCWLKGGNGDGWTWDEDQNFENHRTLEEFASSLDISGMGLRGRALGEVEALVCREEGRSRRIDYVFYRQPEMLWSVSNAELVKWLCPSFVPSDHFGVCVDLEMEL